MSDADYIVVGAGSAGCVLANRLTGSGRHQVLLLEAGGRGRWPWLHVPIGYGVSFHDPRVNWMYSTEPEPGLGERVVYWPRGKVLGGSSAINAMVWIRGQAADFDDWEALGNPGWGWADVLPWFMKCEHNAAGANALRAVGGPLDVADVSADVHPLCEVYLRAAEQAGLARNADFNGETQEGAGLYQITTRDGRRMSAARAYLRPAMKRSNLRVRIGAQATRILFEGKRAVGVEYLRGGRRVTARANREVIIAAGAINSPQLLQLSGVGPRDLLRPLGIDMVVDRPAVGLHLQDHLGVDHYYRSRVPTLNDELHPWSGKLRAGLRYLLTRRGPLSLSVNQAGGFFRTRAGLERPNMQLYFTPISYLKGPPGKRLLMSPDRESALMIGVSQTRPTSRGSLRIRSADPLQAPAMHANYLGTDEDVREMLEGVRFLRRLAAAPALAAVIEHELEPGAEVQSDEALLAHIRARGSSVFHPIGTCRMGPQPADSVVDARLKVHGIAGLRVIDASVFPTLTSGNTNAPAIMVGEKGAGLVLEDA